MDIKIMCDWCGKVIKTVHTFEAVRDAQQKDESICPICLKKVAKIDKYLESIKQRYESRVDALVKELKKDFQDSLKKGDFDGGEDIQDVGSKDKASRG